MERRLLIFILVLIWGAYTQTLMDRAYERLVQQRALNSVLIHAAFRRRRNAIRQSYRRRRQIMRAYHDAFSVVTQAGPLR